MKMTRKALAQKIASELDCTTRVWVKGTMVRVYLSNRGNEYGYVSITNVSVDLSLTGYARNTYLAAIRNAAEGIEILPDNTQSNAHSSSRTVEQIVQARNSGGDFTTDETERVLNAMYGKDGWDERDRIDARGLKSQIEFPVFG